MKKKVILIDGNNLLFRGYYATAYKGNFMNNTKGFPTNALFGFVNMINKIINEENPEYIMVAFDTGKNFRKDLYKNYKDGRIETPKELKEQFPIAKEIITYMGIKYIECDNYEADDIIGSFAKMVDNDSKYNATIISSDKDLLQLISEGIDVKLLKQSGYEMMNNKSFFESYGIAPIKMIDLKSLMGDSSDNIPGVKGIGEKTALTLLQKYGSLDNVYNNIDDIKGKLKEKLINDKDNAYFSYKLATIFKDIDFNYTFDDIKYLSPNKDKLIEIYKELEFNSFLKNIDNISPKKENNNEYKLVKGIINIEGEYSVYIECDGTNYHNSNIIGASIYNGKESYYFDLPAIILNQKLFKNSKVTFDLKKNIVLLNKLNIDTNSEFDTMIASYLLNYNTKDDVSYLASTFNYEIPFYDMMYIKKNNYTMEDKSKSIVTKSIFLYNTYEEFNKKLINEELMDLYKNIEHPLIRVLSSMEIEGITVDKDIINSLKDEFNVRLENISNTIYNYAGEEFNISSPKQLSTILFDKLGLKRGKGKKESSTSHDVLVKYSQVHPIINEILEYRNLSKLVGTYLDGYDEYIHDDGKVHTIYKQTGTRTGRLSSIEPNLQNIPVRSEEGRMIRKSFISEKNSYLLSSDYSQIELRVLAHISDAKSLKQAFINNEDIHTHVASDIFNVNEENVTKNQRRAAKAVIFGIVYGISGFGLGENLDISFNEAKQYIDKYLALYPEVNDYMKNIVESAKKDGYVRTIFGRKRVIDEIHNTNYMIRQMGERIALNAPIQGSSADIIKLAMIKIYNELNKNNYKTKMILQVHDELIFEVPDNELDTIINLVKDTMENIYKLSVPLKVEIEYGKNWYEA